MVRSPREKVKTDDFDKPDCLPKYLDKDISDAKDDKRFHCAETVAALHLIENCCYLVCFSPKL